MKPFFVYFFYQIAAYSICFRILGMILPRGGDDIDINEIFRYPLVVFGNAIGNINTPDMSYWTN